MPMMTAPPSKSENIPDGRRPPTADNHADDSPPSRPCCKGGRLESGKPGWWPSGICVIVSIGHPSPRVEVDCGPTANRGWWLSHPAHKNWPFGRLLSNDTQTHKDRRKNCFCWCCCWRRRKSFLLFCDPQDPPTNFCTRKERKNNLSSYAFMCVYVCLCVFVWFFSHHVAAEMGRVYLTVSKIMVLFGFCWFGLENIGKMSLLIFLISFVGE